MKTPSFILRVALATAALATHTATHAVVYANDAGRYSVDVNSPWIPPPTKQLRPDAMIRCAPDACGHDVLITFGALYEAGLKNGKVSDFLKYANGKTLTQDLQKSRVRFTIAAEGRTRVGSIDGYEVVADVVNHDGQRYTRHTFMTFNAGTIYTIHLISPVDAHDKALKTAQPLIDSFSVK